MGRNRNDQSSNHLAKQNGARITVEWMSNASHDTSIDHAWTYRWHDHIPHSCAQGFCSLAN